MLTYFRRARSRGASENTFCMSFPLPKTEGTCGEIQKQREALWTFVQVEAIAFPPRMPGAVTHRDQSSGE